MPQDCKPPVAVAKSRFSKAFDNDFFVILRERTLRTLEYMQTNAIEVEENRATSTSFKAKENSNLFKRPLVPLVLLRLKQKILK